MKPTTDSRTGCSTQRFSGYRYQLHLGGVPLFHGRVLYLPEANDLRSDSDDGWRLTYNKRQKLQLDLTQSIGSYGSFFVSGYQQDYWHEDGYERTLSTGWNGNINGISYSVSYSYSDYLTAPSLPTSSWRSASGTAQPLYAERVGQLQRQHCEAR